MTQRSKKEPAFGSAFLCALAITALGCGGATPEAQTADTVSDGREPDRATGNGDQGERDAPSQAPTQVQTTTATNATDTVVVTETATTSDPEVVSEPPTLRGSMTRREIDEVVESHRAELNACYATALETTPDLAGRVVFRIILSPTGNVQVASVRDVGNNARAAAECMVAAIRGWTFPPPLGGGIVILMQPFVMTPAAEEPVE